MTYRGHIKSGVVVFDDSVVLPEGIEVVVDVPQIEKDVSARKGIPSLYERLQPFVGKVPGLPVDASVNLDHYLYGTPKQA